MNVLGLGFRASATLDSFKTGVSGTNFLDKIDLIAVPHDKIKNPMLIRFASFKGLDLMPISEESMSLQTTDTISQYSKLYKSVGSVAEAVALAGAGKNSILIVTRVISEDRLVSAAVAGCSLRNERDQS